MCKTSTINELFDGLRDEETELDKLISLNNEEGFDEVFNYLDTLMCNASDKSVEKILKFAENYRAIKYKKDLEN